MRSDVFVVLSRVGLQQMRDTPRTLEYREAHLMLGRRTLIVLTLLVVVLGTAGPATAQTRSQRLRGRMLQLVNQSRTANGVAPLTINWRLSRYAWKHSRQMAINRRAER